MALFKVEVDRVGAKYPAFVDIQITDGDLHLAFTLTPQGARGLAGNLEKAAAEAGRRNRRKHKPS
jgi:hypothetical protein